MRQSDVVITTAQLFGRPAPRIVSRDMVEAMQPGSVVVDMAVETGGNVEGSARRGRRRQRRQDDRAGQPAGSEVARNATEMYANNLFNLLDEFWDKEEKLDLDPEDEIVRAASSPDGGEIVNETIKNL